VKRRPKLLMVGRTRYRLPLNETLRIKFDALAEQLDLRVLASGVDGAPKHDDVFELAGPWRPRRLDGALYFLTLPSLSRRELRRHPPDAVLVQGAHETWFVLLGRSLSGVRTPVILDVHGDWRSPTRLYGSPARRLLSPLADRLALSALRRADAVRTISDYTTELVRSHGVEPAAEFPAFMDLEPFLAPVVPLPALQGDRRPRRGVAHRSARAAGGDAAPGREGVAPRRRRVAPRRSPGPDGVDRGAPDRGRGAGPRCRNGAGASLPL
jgi:hypothetical protein